MDYIPYFEDQIIIQEQAIRSFKRWISGFVVLGLVVVAAAVVLTLKSLGGIAPPIISLGGVFIGTLAAFPYREITPRRSKIRSYSLLKSSFQQFSTLPPDEQEDLKDLAIETIKNNIK